MMTASMQDLSTQISINQVTSVANIPFHQLRLDSRQLAPSDVFVLLKSQTPNCQKSRDYLYQAANNAAFILSEIDPVALTDDSQYAYRCYSCFDNRYYAAVCHNSKWLRCLAQFYMCPIFVTFWVSLCQARLQYQLAHSAAHRGGSDGHQWQNHHQSIGRTTNPVNRHEQCGYGYGG